MLHPEKAQERLKEFQDENLYLKRLKKVGDLPKAACEVGRMLLGRNRDGKEFKDWQVQQKQLAKLPDELDALGNKQRHQLFAVLFPKLSGYVEKAWNLLKTMPYQIGSTRKCFRAPNHSGATRQRRTTWLTYLLYELREIDQDVEWLAAWAAYLHNGYGAEHSSYLFAAAINDNDAVGDRVFEILKLSASNQHEIGAMGRHVTRSLLACDRVEAWEFMEKFLLAAQRQEGLRQNILEAIDESHSRAFCRMLDVIRENNLVRFSATVRAVDVWFNLHWDSISAKKVNDVLDKIASYLNDSDAREAALKTGDGEEVYLALWSIAFFDVSKILEPAEKLLTDKGVGRRFAVLTFLNHAQTPLSVPLLLKATEDEDLRVAMTAMNSLLGVSSVPDDDFDEDEATWASPGVPDLFERIEKFLPRLPEKPTTLKPLVWPWAEVHVDRRNLSYQLVQHLGTRSPKVLIPHLPHIQGYAKGRVIHLLANRKPWDRETRQTIFALLTDKDSSAREASLTAIQEAKLEPGEAEQVEALLTRSGASIRRGAIKILLGQKAKETAESNERLLVSANRNQRVAGLSMLLDRAVPGKLGKDVRERGLAYQAEYEGKLNEEELTILDSLARTGVEQPTLANGLGLFDPMELTPVKPPKARKVQFFTQTAIDCIQSLDEFIHEHRETSYRYKNPYNSVESDQLLGQGYYYTWDAKKSLGENLGNSPLHELLEKWYDDRPKKLRDKDGLELLRAYYYLDDINEWRLKYLREQAKEKPSLKGPLATILGDLGEPKVRYHWIVKNILQWFDFRFPSDKAIDWLLDATETAYTMVPDVLLKYKPPTPKTRSDYTDFREFDIFSLWYNNLQQINRERFTDAQFKRFWELSCFRDRPTDPYPRKRPHDGAMVRAFEKGIATKADVYDHLLGPREETNYWRNWHILDSLQTFSRHADPERPDTDPALSPELKAMADAAIDRVLEVELGRGDPETAATQAARSIAYLQGIPRLFTFLKKLKGRKLKTDYYSLNRESVLTHLVQVTQPGAGDTLETFTEQVALAKKEGVVDDERLLELSFLAPQWLPFVEKYLNWDGMTDGVYWYLVHSHGRAGIRVEKEWEKAIAERTALSDTERGEGAVDAAWFHRVYAKLGRKRWQQLGAAAKLGVTHGSGHKKAAMLGEVLLGKAKKSDLVKGIRQRMLKENVRLLGLLPLMSGAKRELDLQNRYKVLQGYMRYAKSLSTMSREGAVRTAQIGIENLARTAGYPDPIRLEWEMEARSVADIAQGPIIRTVEGVTVTLFLDENGKPETTIMRGEKVLKSMPPKVRKDRKIQQMTDKKADLRRMASRMKGSLEAAKLRGDTFTGTELLKLFEHPVLVPSLERLVLLGEGISGYVVEKGRGLMDHTGRVEPIKPDERLRIAHCHDFYQAGDWHLWQAECFRNERIQPFKQVFRELYVLTDPEKETGDHSLRYSGHQVNPMQAQALWASRGWGTKEEIRKRYHDVGITAEVSFVYAPGTALEVEGWTLDKIRFYRRGEFVPMKLEDVPPRIFSETMRDCDLVVSVAHRGGVDPEASMSTVEMRAALLRETCSLLKIDNTRQKGNHLLIDGSLGNYTLHLGSGVVHKMPGGSLCIIPVHAQHRGRMFLPFADDDPKTAEVISKTLLLARDHEIQDPSILDQLRSR